MIGHVFEKLQKQVEFAGPYDEYADTLAAEEQDTVYTKTVDGVSVTLSEIYTNDLSMNIGLVIKSEQPFADTSILQDGFSDIALPDVVLKIDGKPMVGEAYGDSGQLTGNLVDAHTYEGILRFDLSEVEVPQQFQMELQFGRIVGGKAVDETPDIPEDLIAWYNEELKKAGIQETWSSLREEDGYKNLTKEQEEEEEKIFFGMIRKYDAQYPEVREPYNAYSYWIVEGDWNYAFEASKSEKNMVTKAVDWTNGDGYTIKSVIKTPFELQFDLECSPENTYTMEVLDSKGRFLQWGSEECDRAVRNMDCSSVYIYLVELNDWDEVKAVIHCGTGEEDYRDYMNEHAIFVKRVDFSEEQ